MPLTMYQASVPAIVQTLKAISAVLDKAIAHCEARSIDQSVLINYRLVPDMLPLSAQIQIMTDQVKGAVARLAGLEIPSYPDTETTFPELKERIAKALAFAQSVTPEQINGAEDRDVKLKLGGTEMTLKGSQYYFHFFAPNFYFHAATAYDILRHCGVAIGKRDFIGGF